MSTDVDTQRPVGASSGGGRRGPSLRVGLFVLSLATVVTAVLLVPMPLVESAPGGSQDVGSLVSLDTETTELTGDFGLLTVRVDQPSIVETVRAWVDDDRSLRPRNSVIPAHVDQRRYIEAQQQEFRRAFRVAAAVGLRAAGLETSVRTAAQVVSVLPEGPAAGRLRVGDVIRSFQGTEVSSADELVEVARDVEEGERLTIGVERDGEPLEVVVVAGSVPGLAHPGMGITLQTLEEDIELPFDVELVDQHGIGGPSAGMMVALAVYDLVAEEDLAAGRDVVGTGTVDGDGSVGQVGSIRGKTLTAVNTRADLLLVPAAQVAEATDAAGGRIEVVGVETVEEAIEALRSEAS